MMFAPTRTDSSSAIGGVDWPKAGEVYVMPASVKQQGFWYLDQLQPGNTAYNIAVRFQLSGPLRIPELEQALNAIVRRHESLRTHFTSADGVPMQVIAPEVQLKLDIDDLRGFATDDQPGRIDELTKAEARRPFNLTTGPLIRTRLLRLADGDHHLLLTIHHIVADGWSIGVITRELGEFYRSICDGSECSLAPLPIQLGDFAVWQNEWMHSPQFAEQAGFWATRLGTKTSCEIPANRSHADRPLLDSAIESRLLPRQLTDRIVKLSHRLNATTFMVMLTAVKLLVRRHARQDDVVVGTLVAGRKHVALESLIGPFINPVVLRTEISETLTFSDSLSRVRETVLEAFAHDDIPFELVQKTSQRSRNWSPHLAYQVNFIYQRDFVQPFDAAGLRLTAIPSVSPGPMYDLNVFLVERAEGWRASCEYATSLFSREFVQQLLEDFQTILERAVLEPNCPISHLGGSKTPSSEAGELRDDSRLEQQDESPVEVPVGWPQLAEIQARLQQEWRELLGIDHISDSADFFDLGGHSLLAGRLLARIERQFGVRMTVASLMAFPTVESLAARVRDLIRYDAAAKASAGTELQSGQSDEWVSPDTPVFAMSRAVTKPPLCIVDAGPFLRPLVRQLGDEQSVIGLALPENESLPEKFTVADIARKIVEALVNADIEPPYYLAGWSHAGIIAYEVARQLSNARKRVAMVMLFDTDSPDYLRSFEGILRLPVRIYIRLEKYLHHLNKMRPMSWRQRWDFIRNRLRSFRLPRDSGFEAAWQMQYAEADKYNPQPAEWPIALIRSTALQTGPFRDPHLGWDRVARQGLQVHVMRGEHDTMFTEPEVRNLAKVVRQCMLQREQQQDVLNSSASNKPSVVGHSVAAAPDEKPA